MSTDTTIDGAGSRSGHRRLRWFSGLVAVLAGSFVGGCGHGSINRSSNSFRAASPMPASAAETLFRETFDTLDLTRWRKVDVKRKGKGKTLYQLDPAEGSLKAISHDGASIMLCPLRFRPDEYPWISWRWNVEEPPKGENLKAKDGSDAAARVYVYFDTRGLPWQKRNIDYVWSMTLPVGTVMPSAYSKSSMIIVVESGREHVGEWRTATRNIAEDYRQCFGGQPPEAVAIGLMTDTDNTHSQAMAAFDDVTITREAPAPSKVTSSVK